MGIVEFIGEKLKTEAALKKNEIESARITDR